MNTFQTPDALRPGQVIVGVGAGIGSSGPVLQTNGGEDDSVPIVPLDFYVRLGTLPRLEASYRSAGGVARGAELKYQIMEAPIQMTVNAGFGAGEDSGCLFGGCEGGVSRTQFTGLIVGQIRDQGGFYGGLKMMRYHYVKTFDCDLCENGWSYKTDRIVPAASIGAMGDPNSHFRPLVEVNTYMFEQLAVTLSMGFQIKFFKS